MTKDEAVSTIIKEITFWDCNAKDFFMALKMLSDDERGKVYLAIEQQSRNSLNQEVLCSIRL